MKTKDIEQAIANGEKVGVKRYAGIVDLATPLAVRQERRVWRSNQFRHSIVRDGVEVRIDGRDTTQLVPPNQVVAYEKVVRETRARREAEERRRNLTEQYAAAAERINELTDDKYGARIAYSDIRFRGGDLLLKGITITGKQAERFVELLQREES